MYELDIRVIRKDGSAEAKTKEMEINILSKGQVIKAFEKWKSRSEKI